jgi:hypothetical protein
LCRCPHCGEAKEDVKSHINFVHEKEGFMKCQLPCNSFCSVEIHCGKAYLQECERVVSDTRAFQQKIIFNNIQNIQNIWRFSSHRYHICTGTSMLGNVRPHFLMLCINIDNNSPSILFKTSNVLE